MLTPTVTPTLTEGLGKLLEGGLARKSEPVGCHVVVPAIRGGKAVTLEQQRHVQ